MTSCQGYRYTFSSPSSNLAYTEETAPSGPFLAMWTTLPFVVVVLPFSDRKQLDTAAPTVRRWVSTLGCAGLATLPLGRYQGAATLIALPVAGRPKEEAVCRSRAVRVKRVASGAAFLWCTLAALAGTPVADVAARAFAGKAPAGATSLV